MSQCRPKKAFTLALTAAAHVWHALLNTGVCEQMAGLQVS